MGSMKQRSEAAVYPVDPDITIVLRHLQEVIHDATHRGAVIDAYPYGFVNVATLGYPRVALTLLVILGFALLVAAAFRLVDRLLRRP